MQPLIPKTQYTNFSRVSSPLKGSFVSSNSFKLSDSPCDIKSQSNSNNSGIFPSTDNQQSTPSPQKDFPTPFSSPAAKVDAAESDALKEQMDNIYSEIESNRKEYFNFYNDYRRGGLGEGEYVSRKEKLENKEEKEKDKAIITNIFTELVNIEERQHQVMNKGKRKKG